MSLSNAQYDQIKKKYDDRQLARHYELEKRLAYVNEHVDGFRETNDRISSLCVKQAELLLEGKTSALSDLRESGALEQDANIVMFIHRPDKDKTTQRLNAMAKPGKEMSPQKEIVPNLAEVIIEKNRSGSTGDVELYFKGEYTRFFNYNPETKGPEYESKQNTTREVDMDMQTYSQEDEVAKSIDSEIF